LVNVQPFNGQRNSGSDHETDLAQADEQAATRICDAARSL